VSAPRKALLTERATPSASVPIRSSSTDTSPSSSRKSASNKLAIGKTLHQCFQPLPVQRPGPLAHHRAPGGRQFAWAHPPERIRRQAQHAQPEAHRLLPGKGVHASSPNVALSNRTAISDRKSTRLNSSHVKISYA